MKSTLQVVRFGMAALIGVIGAFSVHAQESSDRTVEQYTCKDILRESGSNREVAVAFLHGFLLGKSGGSKFNLDTLTKQTDEFFERCLDNPRERAVDVMTKIKN
jgi:hypothetical protein